MPYTVIWLRNAEDELARIWIRASDRQAVTQAANEIDHLLRFSPQARGNDQPGISELSIPPLSVDFAVSLDDYR